jgi:uncharacterized protein (TIGR02646 family)
VKLIDKGPSPITLEAWKQGQRDADLRPAFSDLQNPEKSDCRLALVAEQGAICCYCNGEISPNSMHIEHLIPQGVDESLDVEWDNLLGCCPPQNKKGRRLQTQSHCGEFRGDKILNVTPLDADCETRFGYSLHGQIRPAIPGDAAATETLKVLNLTAEALRSRRQRLIAQAYEDLGSLPMEAWLDVYVRRSSEGFHEFAAMFNWFMRDSWGAESQALYE